MIKKNKVTLIISSIVILLPILVGLLLWDKLPELVATHWGVDGQPDGWMGRPFAVFGIPVLILILHWVGVLVTARDRGNSNQSEKVMKMALWVTPAISVLSSGVMYAVVLGFEPGMHQLLPVVLGILFLAIGNYLPKCKRNRTIGIKLVWTVYNEENWNATHRFAGKLWVAAGALSILCAFLPGDWAILAPMPVLLLAGLAPMVYSYCYYQKQRKEGLEEIKAPASSKRAVVALVLVLAVILGLVGTGSVTVDYQQTCFVVDSDRHDSLTIAYDVVDKVEYREDVRTGTRVFGYAGFTLLLGQFHNDEFGTYTRYTYTGCESCVVVTAGENILVLNGADEDATKTIYEELKVRIG